MSHRKGKPDCPLCHGYGIIVETDHQKSAPACKCTYDISELIAEKTTSPVRLLEGERVFHPIEPKKYPSQLNNNDHA
jgi:hypothetical protein